MKPRHAWRALRWAAVLLAAAAIAWAQNRPYIGYVYPAGGEVGATVSIRLGGQELDDVTAVLITGSGVTGKVTEVCRRLNNQEIQLLREQLTELKRNKTPDTTTKDLIAKIERRVGEWVQTPACASISSLVLVSVTVAPEAEPGPREIRLVSSRGVSGPLAFYVGQLPESTRKPMLTATLQILGKEAQALRKRPAGDAEERITLPCTVNGQIASGEVNRYRFNASKGQRLVLSTLARQLVPFIADAVPGWFQPVLTIYDAQGHEVAYNDDYRFKPDPVIVFEVPADGEYVFAIHDSLYRGREDFVYRITAGELPFVTSLFPLGGPCGATLPPNIAGINMSDASVSGLAASTKPTVESLAASRMGLVSNRVPFAVEGLPETFEHEPNNIAATAQKISLPVVVNGRIGQPDDWDVYQFTGRARDNIVIDVEARRLDSPLDSVVKLTDATGNVIAFNDDREDLTGGTNTHAADSYLTAKLPADGTYFVAIGDTARKGGDEYGYRLRVSAPQPDFELRIVPSSLSIPINAVAGVTVYAARKDGFAGPIKLALQDPPAGFSAAPITLAANQNTIRFNIKASAKPTGPIKLTIVGTAKLGDKDATRGAIAAEDRMQAFLWRQLVPARDFQVVVFDRNNLPPPKRVAPTIAPPAAPAQPLVANTATAATSPKPKFTKQQIVGRLRQLKLLYEEGLLTDEFYGAKVTECETGA